MSCIPPHYLGHFPDVSHKNATARCASMEYGGKITTFFPFLQIFLQKKYIFFVFFLLFAISICLFLRLYVHSAGFYPAFYFVRCTGYYPAFSVHFSRHFMPAIVFIPFRRIIFAALPLMARGVGGLPLRWHSLYVRANFSSFFEPFCLSASLSQWMLNGC